MEPLKHECGVALIRLRKPLEYYRQKYGTYTYALDKLYLLMEKQHNRGQEAAGIGVVKTQAPAGYELIYRERALGKDAIPEIFAKVGKELPHDLNSLPAGEVDAFTPYIGEVYMGHLRYSTTGRSGISYAHPVLRRNNWRSRSLLLCGNFNMTNVSRMFDKVVSSGQHPRIYSDTNMILEQIGYALDKENHRLYREYRDTLHDPVLAHTIEDNLDMAAVLRNVAPEWDGGFVMCGATGSGDMFALRDSHGIRPAFYYVDDEIVVLASERPVIQTTFDLGIEQVCELGRGEALIVDKAGGVSVKRILPDEGNCACSFERIYFSRGSDADIYRERKALGASLVRDILEMIHYDVDNTVFSFIPNTAEVAFFGMMQKLEERLDRCKHDDLKALRDRGEITDEKVNSVLSRRIRVEKVAIKDVKMRTFIAEGASRDDMVAHVYDVTYGSLRPGIDNLVIIDDSIVRGTTLKQSIIGILDRLGPKKIVIVSSSPQVRYPDYYGIDMAKMSEFIAFRAAVELLKERDMKDVIAAAYRKSKDQVGLPKEQMINYVKDIYAPFTDEEISGKMVELLTPKGTKAKVEIVYQPLEGLHEACPHHKGDWYFSGNYPTPGGVKMVNRAFIDYIEQMYQF